MITWTKCKDNLPTSNGWYLIFTIDGYPKIEEANYYVNGGVGYFTNNEDVIVDALYWAEANFPEEYTV